jgi:septum site-determining protein MinD
MGTPVTLGSPGSVPAQAYLDAVRRLKGEVKGEVVPTSGRTGLLGKLFLRRAA